MKNAVLICLLLLLSFAVIAQKPSARKRGASAKPAAAPAAAPEPPKPLDENEEFQKASALELAADRVAALRKFLADFPNSEKAAAARELISSSRILIAEEKLNLGDAAGAAAAYKLAVEEAPDPISAELYTESIAKIPANLFWKGARAEAVELAGLIEKRVAGNAAQLVELANFYISIENGSEALRVAQAAAAADPSYEPAYRTIGLAHRVNFDLEESASAFAKALELAPDSAAAKRGLAEMKRALGKPDEALVLYRELLDKNDSDLPARTGLVLSLFESGKKAEAENELAKSLEQSPGNVILLAGAAYWYASQGNSARAVELAQRAIEKEPRFIWSHIALARGLMSQEKPVDAEQALIKARQYGNFPTLEYEIASARIQAGFYRDAVEGIRKSFSITDGQITTKLGGRIPRSQPTFSDLVAYERRASIFAAAGASDAETGRQLKTLLELDERLSAPEPDEAAVAAAVDEFTGGSDRMKLHRQLYAASVLLQKKVGLPKVLELTKAATADPEGALDVPNAAAAVMASELYDGRSIAFSRGEYLLIPAVPRQTLSAIIRGRIEELAGWALYQQGSYPESAVRLKRAISVLPDKSAWWRSSMWRLGAALEAEGKENEALDRYIESYKTDKPDYAKFVVVESLYKKVNGSTEGLDAAVGPERMLRPADTAVVKLPEPAANARPAAEPEPSASPTATPEIVFPKSVPVRVEPEPAIEKLPAELPKADAAVTSPTELKTEPPRAELSRSSEAQRPADEPKAPVTVSEPRPSATPAELPADPDTDPQPAETQPKPLAESKTKTDEVPENIQTAAKPETKPEEPAKTEPTKNEPAEAETVTEKPAEKDDRKVPPPGDAEPPAAPPGDRPEAENARLSERSEAEASRPAKLVVVKGELPPPIDLTKKTKTPAHPPVAKQPAATDSLFKPVIITIPDSSAKAAKPEQRENVPADVGDRGQKPDDAALASGAGRLRVVVNKEITGASPQTCTLTASESTVSILNNGGSVGLLVGLEGKGDIKKLTALSSSPNDIEVKLEPEIAGAAAQRFYVIRSISETQGVFQVRLDAGCGRKEITVNVR